MSDGEARNWPGELRAGGPATEAAVADLRGVLLRGLRRALTGRAGADDALIEDLAQEATLRVLDRLDGYRGDSRFTTWAVAVAVRVALTGLRRPRVRGGPLDRLAVRGRGVGGRRAGRVARAAPAPPARRPPGPAGGRGRGGPGRPARPGAGPAPRGRAPRAPRPAPGGARGRADRAPAGGAGRRAAGD